MACIWWIASDVLIPGIGDDDGRMLNAVWLWLLLLLLLFLLIMMMLFWLSCPKWTAFALLLMFVFLLHGTLCSCSFPQLHTFFGVYHHNHVYISKQQDFIIMYCEDAQCARHGM
jgi:hypothetical protein